MSTCQTCRHWFSHRRDIDASAVCTSARLAGDVMDQLVNGTNDRDGAWYQFGPLYTGPDFGCVKHAPIEPTTRIPEWRMI